MTYTAQDYRNAMDILAKWATDHTNPGYPPFNAFCQAKIKELEKPKNPQYKCIKEPTMYNNGTFELGKIYNTDWRCCEFSLLDLPNHFELVVPEPEKITWEEVGNLIEDVTRTEYSRPEAYEVDLVRIFNRVKIDHLS